MSGKYLGVATDNPQASVAWTGVSGKPAIINDLGVLTPTTDDMIIYNGSNWVVVSKQTGWTAGTGTPQKGAFSAYAGATMSVTYVQAEAQATNDAVKNVSQRLLAIEQALTNHKIINA